MIINKNFPDEPGYYFWYDLDLNWMDVGSVHVTKDPLSHRVYLKTRRDDSSFYVFVNSRGETLTMYHDNYRHLPHIGKDGRPQADGWAKYNPDDLFGNTFSSSRGSTTQNLALTSVLPAHLGEHPA